MKLKIFFLQGAWKRDDRKPCILERFTRVPIHLIINEPLSGVFYFCSGTNLGNILAWIVLKISTSMFLDKVTIRSIDIWCKRYCRSIDIWCKNYC